MLSFLGIYTFSPQLLNTLEETGERNSCNAERCCTSSPKNTKQIRQHRADITSKKLSLQHKKSAFFMIASAVRTSSF